MDITKQSLLVSENQRVCTFHTVSNVGFRFFHFVTKHAYTYVYYTT